MILAWRLDTALFAALALLTLVVGREILRRRRSVPTYRRLTYFLVIFTIAAGIWFSEAGDRGERAQIRQLVSGFAPTFAHELSELGHAQITLETPPDDPRYLALIQRQKDWLRLNPQISDIYTYRRAPDGRIVFIVDSETDYNHDARYEGEREQRTPIGYPYEAADATNLRALSGEALFDTAIIADQWGRFISFDQPMYNAAGEVEAVLGVDFPADTWISAILYERFLPLVIAFIFLLVIVVSSTLIALMRSEIDERKKTAVALQEARVEAERANRGKSEFLAAMSHEIRTPMNSLIGFSNLLIDTPLTAEQRDYTLTLRSSANSLLTLLNDILDLSKIEAGRTQIEQIPFSVRDTISAVATLMGPRASDKKLAFIVDNPTGDLKIVGDPHRFRQVLMNLISNAVKFTDTGAITVLVRWQAVTDTTGVLRCDVTDTGIGIPADMVRQLFQKFAQADISTTRRYGGTGLGLAISRELTQLMGGTLTVKSEFGYGSTFTVQLPATVHEGALSAPPTSILGRSTSPFAPPPSSAGRILLVDDNAINRKLTTIVLEKLGYTADCAVNGREALDKVFTQNYRAVLMDCEMPELDGFETTRAIRTRECALPGRPHVPVIALTANAMAEAEEKCLASGMDVYLTKPVQLEVLRKTLAQATARTA